MKRHIRTTRSDAKDKLIEQLQATVADLKSELASREDGKALVASVPFHLQASDDGFFSSPPLSKLSPREREVLAAYIETRNSKEIASLLGTKLQTIQNQLASIEGKLDVHCREDLVAWVLISWFQRYRQA